MPSKKHLLTLRLSPECRAALDFLYADPRAAVSLSRLAHEVIFAEAERQGWPGSRGPLPVPRRYRGRTGKAPKHSRAATSVQLTASGHDAMQFVQRSVLPFSVNAEVNRTILERALNHGWAPDAEP